MRGYSKILVTGGAGFIGSHLVDRLLDEGFEVTVLDDFSAGLVQNISIHKDKQGFGIVRGDIRNAVLVRKLVRNVDAVFHQAALVDVASSVEDPLLFNDVNVVGTLTLLKACLGSNVKRFIFASSAAVYGGSAPAEKSENMLPEPMSPYAVSKLAAECYVGAFNELYDLRTVSLRYFNVYGPRQGFGSSYSGVITTFVNQLLKDEPPIIHGDGNQTRDFVHVSDVVSACVLALENKNAVGGVFNIASGTATRVCDLATMLQQIMNKSHLMPIHVGLRVGDIRHCCGDVSKAESLLGFHPRIKLRDGLLSLVDWQKGLHRSNLGS